MKILVAPLNWGLGHATRCIPLVSRFLEEGNEVVLGGDGESLLRLRQAFPTLRFIPLAPLNLQYGKTKSQVLPLLRALPQFIRFSHNDRGLLEQLYINEHFDLIVSDNRFGLYSKLLKPSTRFVYVTHQLFVRLPRGWRWLEGLAQLIHRLIYNRFDEIWVPDYKQADKCLSGALSHRQRGIPDKVKYIGPLSRLTPTDQKDTTYPIVALLSGLEPQRTILEQEIKKKYYGHKETVLIIRGKIGAPSMTVQHDNITIIPHLKDEDLVKYLNGADTVICRSGYSTIMDLDRLGVLHKAQLHPTPGQSEQEYLADFIDKKRKEKIQ